MHSEKTRLLSAEAMNQNSRIRTFVSSKRPYTPPVKPDTSFCSKFLNFCKIILLISVFIFIGLPLLSFVVAPLAIVFFSFYVCSCIGPIYQCIKQSQQEKNYKLLPANSSKIAVSKDKTGKNKCVTVQYSANVFSAQQLIADQSSSSSSGNASSSSSIIVKDLDIKPAVVFLGGLGLSNILYFEEIERVFGAHYKCMTYDRLGLGYSDDLPRSGEAGHVRDVQALTKELHTILHDKNLCIKTPVVLIGASLGGLIAQAYYYEHPDDVAALVLIDPPGNHLKNEKGESDGGFFSFMAKIAPITYKIAGYFSVVGVTRLFFNLGLYPAELKQLIACFPQEHIKDAIFEEFCRTRVMSAFEAEFKTLPDSFNYLDKLNEKGTKPIHVPCALASSMDWPSSFGGEDFANNWSGGQYKSVIEKATGKAFQIKAMNCAHAQLCSGEFEMLLDVVNELLK